LYKLHLILKYLLKRRIAWVSLIAVMLCTLMVIVVISVMGGWLRMFKESFHDLTGDIVVSRRSLTGFPHYQEMIDRIEKLPEVAGAAPTLQTFGLVNINNSIRDGVQVIGLPLDKMNHINAFRKSLHRQYQEPLELENDPNTPPEQRAELRKQIEAPATFDKPYPAETYKEFMPDAKVDVTKWPGIITGAGVIGIGKDKEGHVHRPAGVYTAWVRLTVLGLHEDSTSLDVNEKVERAYWIVDDSRTGVWQYDSQTVYVPFEILQKDLRMDEQTVTDAATGQKIIEPARTTDIRIGLKPGLGEATLWATRDKIAEIVHDVLGADSDQGMDPVRVQTWMQFNAKYIAAIENEKVLVVVLFGIISIVAIFLIFCIFYMIVVEKTRDIGIIKSVGATSGGVAGIFLGYGLAIGIVGSFLGLLGGYLIVHNINFLHSELSKLMGITIWNPEVYAFDIIPHTMNPVEVSVIMAIAVIASVIGALVPAIRAASLHPVEALRWE
jgi:lipoprotein-releasing system permease protein